MSLPRQVLPGRFYLLTRNCAQRQFLLRPDEVTNATFAYCLAEAAARWRIQIILPLASTNHHHTVLFDPEGTIEEFMEHFHKMVAKAMNAHRGRCENFWAAEAPSLVELVGVAAVIDKLVYTATNPVKDDLVTRAEDWPGFSGLAALLAAEPIVAHRPAYFRQNGRMPAIATLELVIPPELGDADAVRAELRQRIAEAERRFATRRRAAGKRVLGAAAVKRQEWWWSPTSRRPRRRLHPRVAAKDYLRRLEVLRRNKEFQRAYRVAYRAWRDGDLTVVFPAGTYWLARFANVRVAPLEKA